MENKIKIDCIVADIRHNKYRINPLTGEGIGLTEEAIRRFEQTLTEEDREVRIHGKFRYLSGRVWKMWDRLVHTIDRNTMWVEGKYGCIKDGQPPRSWPRLMVIDPHDEKPHALLWVAKEPEHELLYCYREAWLQDMTFLQVCKYVRQIELENRDMVQFRIMDPNMGPKTQGVNKNKVRDDFEQESRNIGYPMRFIMGDDHEALGRKKVEELLMYDTAKPISIINRPKLYVCSDLVQCIYQIEHFVWPDRPDDKPDPTIEKPVHKHDDFPSCCRYLALFPWPSHGPTVLQGYGNAYSQG